MSARQASKRGAQILNNSLSNTPSKPVRSKMGKRNESKEGMEETKHEDVQSMFDLILGKLDVIDDRVESVEQELKELRAS